MRKTFIHKSEQLLIWTEYGEHVSVHGEIEKISDAMGHIDESVIKIFRVDDEWNFEDVTEDIAMDWIDQNADDPDTMSVKGAGLWLEKSQALADYIDDCAGSRSVRAEHSTLNHAQQGISRR